MLINLLSRNFGIKAIVQNCPLNRYSLFEEFKTRKKLINTNNFFNNMISWPFYTYMKKKDFDYMIRSTIKSLEIIRKKP
jgi:dTDP-4-amino-4,6-dideoxygalactose transaminase